MSFSPFRSLRCCGVLLLSSCVGTPGPGTLPELPAAAEPGLAPFPFTAAEIRAANPPGTELVFRFERPGQAPMTRRTRFLSSDAERVTMDDSVLGADGTWSSPQSGEVRWEQLRRHASFPAAKTRLTRATQEIGGKTHDCWLYTVESVEKDLPLTSFYWFDPQRAGPPLALERRQQGVTVLRMELVEYRRGASAADAGAARGRPAGDQ